MFSVGQKVVCIAPHPEWEERGCIVPKVGGLYTVRAIDETDGLLLEEVINEGCLAWLDTASGLPVTPGEDSFWQQRFRAVVKRKTDISIFKKMLDEAAVIAHEAAQMGPAVRPHEPRLN
jgi:hypothetical protein